MVAHFGINHTLRNTDLENQYTKEEILSAYGCNIYGRMDEMRRGRV
jgi:hypothetical protein